MLCRLCLQEKKLLKSHIIPRMFFTKLKSLVGNKFYKSGYENKIAQDGIKTTFLCEDCEKLFANYKTYFSREVIRSSNYNNANLNLYKIKYFILSITWRCLAFSLENEHITPEEKQVYHFESVEEKWRRLLLYKDLDKLSLEQFFLIPLPCDALDKYSICALDNISYGFPITDNFDGSHTVAFCLVVPQFVMLANIQGAEHSYLKYEVTDERQTSIEEVPLTVHEWFRKRNNEFNKDSKK